MQLRYSLGFNTEIITVGKNMLQRDNAYSINYSLILVFYDSPTQYTLHRAEDAFESVH